LIVEYDDDPAGAAGALLALLRPGVCRAETAEPEDRPDPESNDSDDEEQANEAA
jgi:hypothetical protein